MLTAPALGSGESGKSTIVKQMKIIHQNGYTTDELMAYRHTIYKNLIDSAHHIILAMRKLAMDCEDPANRARTEKILDYVVSPAPTFYFSEEMDRFLTCARDEWPIQASQRPSRVQDKVTYTL